MNTTVDSLLQQARTLGLARLDAQLLLGAALGQDRAWLLAHGEHVPSSAQATHAMELLRRRADGVPLAYLLGQREFHGLMLQVTPAVLDPRPDTETLVDWALALPLPPQARVVDLGTGSGAIALALLAQRPGWQVHASDRSTAALAVARANAQRLGLPVAFHEGPWWRALPADLRPHLAVSNPPYIPAGDPHLAALRHEPQEALVAGENGLKDLRELVTAAPQRLAPGGWLLLEHGHEQGPAVAALLQAAGFEAVAHRLDLAGHTRCTGGRLAG